MFWLAFHWEQRALSVWSTEYISSEDSQTQSSPDCCPSPNFYTCPVSKWIRSWSKIFRTLGNCGSKCRDAHMLHSTTCEASCLHPEHTGCHHDLETDGSPSTWWQQLEASGSLRQKWQYHLLPGSAPALLYISYPCFISPFYMHFISTVIWLILTLPRF